MTLDFGLALFASPPAPRTSARARSAGGKRSSDSALSSLLGPIRPRGTLPPLSKTPPVLPFRSLAVLWAEACRHAESCSRFISADFNFPALKVLDQIPNSKTHPNSSPKWILCSKSTRISFSHSEPAGDHDEGSPPAQLAHAELAHATAL